MGVLEGIALLVFACAAGGVCLVFLLYPLGVALASRLRRREPAGTVPAGQTRASLLVAVRNAEGLIVDKVRNSLALDHPGLELVFVSDGSSDRTAELIRQHSGGRIRLLEFEQHLGKAQALNRGAELCSGEVLVFSDADALLARDALQVLLRHYADPLVGGVCGQRVIGEDPGELDHAQGRYIALDSALKLAESRVGSITSNDGKLYSIRRSLFRPIAGGATDDLYSCLNVVEQGRRFVFEPRALAFIKKPARSPAHELARRRRIVSRSLTGILLMRRLLNPLRYGAFSIGLLVNKVFRRLLPVFLMLLLVSTAALAWERLWARVVLAAQLLFYGLALFHPLLRRASGLRVLARAGGLAFYFCLGNLGTLLGLGDFLRRRETIKWDPLKAD
jgi:cellulose synthase/poly-beta-1,6-N-acetylglucosamine synthase-like glycosyltransferase